MRDKEAVLQAEGAVISPETSSVSQTGIFTENHCQIPYQFYRYSSRRKTWSRIVIRAPPQRVY